MNAKEFLKKQNITDVIINKSDLPEYWKSISDLIEEYQALQLQQAGVSSSVFRYCWLNINDGKFSNSWSEEDMKYIDDEMLSIANKDGWKLIKYQCLTDENFEFYNQMQLR